MKKLGFKTQIIRDFKKNTIFLFLSLFLFIFPSFSRIDIREINGGGWAFIEGKTTLIDELAVTITFIVVVLSLVIILLYLGGILKFQGPSFRFFRYLPVLVYIGLIFIIFILPILQRLGYIHIFPDNPDEILKRKEFEGFRQIRLPHGICLFFKYLNLSEMVSCYMPAFIYFFLLPIAAIYTIVWSFLKQLNLFEKTGKKLEALLAFIITFMSLPMGSLSLLVAISFSIVGALSIAVFVSMLLLGIFSIGFLDVSKRYKEITRELSENYENFQRNIISEAHFAIDRISTAKNSDEVEDYLRRFENRTNKLIPAEKWMEVRKLSSDLNGLKRKAIELVRDVAIESLGKKGAESVEKIASEVINKLKSS